MRGGDRAVTAEERDTVQLIQVGAQGLSLACYNTPRGHGTTRLYVHLIQVGAQGLSLLLVADACTLRLGLDFIYLSLPRCRSGAVVVPHLPDARAC